MRWRKGSPGKVEILYPAWSKKVAKLIWVEVYLRMMLSQWSPKKPTYWCDLDCVRADEKLLGRGASLLVSREVWVSMWWKGIKTICMPNGHPWRRYDRIYFVSHSFEERAERWSAKRVLNVSSKHVLRINASSIVFCVLSAIVRVEDLRAEYMMVRINCDVNNWDADQNIDR